MSDEVKVHNIRGEVICKIETPVTWKDNLLSFAYISRKWRSPQAIEGWAWNTAEKIARWMLQDHEVKLENNTLVWDSGAFCLSCMNYSITPVSRAHYKGFFKRQYDLSRGVEIIGYWCNNENCAMHRVVIPKVLVERIGEKPR